MLTSTAATIALPGAVLVGLLAAVVARRRPLVVPLLLVVTGLAVAASSVVTGGHRAGPTGYANASAAVCVAGAAAALHLALVAPHPHHRRLSLAAMALLLTMPVWFRSRAAGIGALVVLAGLHPRVQRLTARTVATVGGVAVVATSLATVVLGWLWHAGPGTPGRRISGRLVGVRADLWHTALVRWHADPLRGGGELAPEVTGDADFRRFAHSAVLHVAAVAGTGGVLALVLAFGLVLAALGRAATGPAQVAALGLTALGLQASVDYVGHFVVVLAVFGALVGAALPSDDPLPRRHDP